LVGATSGSAGGTAVFSTSNGAGSSALLLLGALFLLVGLVGVIPLRLKIGENELILAQAAATIRDARLDGDSSLADTLNRLATTYEVTRQGLPSGAQRTLSLETVLLQARALATTISDQTLEERLRRFDTDSEGVRIVTIALLQVKRLNSAAAVNVLTQCATQPRSNFEQFHGLRAAVEIYPTLGEPGRRELRAVAQNYLQNPHVDQAGDRASMARRLLGLPGSTGWIEE